LGIYEMTGGNAGVTQSERTADHAERRATERHRDRGLYRRNAAVADRGTGPGDAVGLWHASAHGQRVRRCEGLQLLLAVLEKRGGFHFGVKDVFLNIAGGLKVEDPSIDLAVLCALLSSYEDVPWLRRPVLRGK
jgi:DNA repair protein RadA/Sms